MILNYLTLILLFVWRVYWRISEHKADRVLPKKEGITSIDQAQRLFIGMAFLLVIIQLLGVQLLPFSSTGASLIGFSLVLTGFVIALLARRELGVNWANSYEYQVKKHQVLVTTGIYSVIRHPIYTAMVFLLIGSELVAQSWLFLLYLFLWLGVYWQARKEEVILVHHFGDAYRDYRKKTYLFIPFVW